MQDIFTRLEKLRLLYKQAREDNNADEMKRLEAKGKFWNNVLKAREKWLQGKYDDTYERAQEIFKTEE